MSDPSIPPVPPKPVLQLTPITATKAAIPLSSPARMLVSDAPVRQTPAGLPKPQEGRSERIEGRVVSNDRVRHEVRIATKSGDITVQTDADIPEGSDVSVELYTKDGAELARITLLKQAAVQDTPQPPALPATQPLKAGDTVTALLLQDETVESPQQQQITAVALQRVAAVLEQLSPQELQQLPQPLPVPPETALKLATSGNLLQALQQLPPEQQQAILQYITRPDVLAKLQTIVTPKALADLAPEPELPATQAAEPIDENMSQIIRTQSAAKSALQSSQPQPEASSGAPLQSAGSLKSLMPLLEVLQGAPGVADTMAMPRLMGGMPSSTAILGQLLPQNMYQMKIISVTPPGLPTPPAPAAPVMQGKVEFITSAGFPVVRAGDSHFILRTLSGVEIGSTVEFEPSAMTPEQIVASATSSVSKMLLPLFSSTWPALQEALDTVAAAAPDVAAQMQNTIPTATQRLAPTALFFLAALKIGVAESWLGPAALQTLRETGKSALADRLTGDFGKISAQAKDNVGGDWKGISMPLLHDGEISQMQFFIRRQHDEAGKEKEDERRTQPTRFILNLHLSRMGDMQLDGLLRKKNFDLILRSADALPLTMRQELMQSFAKGLAQVEMQGGISFQTRRQSWVTVDLPQQGTLA